MTGARTSRLLALACVGALALSACGSSDDSATPVTDADFDADAAAADDAAAAAAATSVPVTALDDTVDSTIATVSPDDKPVVVIPDEVPNDLIVTVLIEGSGPTAEVGDTVVVNYVGVRSEDGFEFDNSYDRGQPFPVILGTGSVIQGWEQGLLETQAGSRVQLDIPANLAYGDADRGDIRPGDALTFVIDIVEIEKRPVITAPPMADASECPATDGSEPKQQEFTEMQPFCIDIDKHYLATVVTNFGEFTVEFDPAAAPQTVNNFVTLARYKYFDDTQCHRVLTDFVVQCGDPEATGFGGPGYVIPDELPLPGQYELGSIAMANAGPDTGGSQFFIISGVNGTGLPPQYSLFGDIIEGFDPVIVELNTLENPDGANGTPPLEPIIIESVTITES